MFFAPDNGGRRTLADLITQKIEEKQQNEEESHQLDPKVIKVYTSVGGILHQNNWLMDLILVIVLVSFRRLSRLFQVWVIGRRWCWNGQVMCRFCGLQSLISGLHKLPSQHLAFLLLTWIQRLSSDFTIRFYSLLWLMTFRLISTSKGFMWSLGNWTIICIKL